MSNIPREPNPGDKISANDIRAIVRALRENRPIAGHGIKLKRGPNGTTFSSTHSSRIRSATYSGRYSIDSIKVPNTESDNSNISIKFKNTYYRLGGKTFIGPDSISDINKLPVIIALKVDITGSLPSPELSSYSSLDEMQQDEGDDSYYISPLYKINASGTIECDFRIGPESSIFEFSNPTSESGDGNGL